MIQSLLGRVRGWQYRRSYGFPERRLDDLLEARDLVIDLRYWNSDKRAGDFFDSLVFSSIARTLRPRLYWEIGTGDGRTALLAACNGGPDTTICTLDPGYPDDLEKGKIFRGLPETKRITQFGDVSTRFDFSQWFGKANLVFVDGSHRFADVLNDSEVAFRLVAPGGWVLWHDVAMDCLDVPKALKQCSRADRIEQISGTRYALYREPK